MSGAPASPMRVWAVIALTLGFFVEAHWACADDYRLARTPKQASGSQGEAPLKKPDDPKVCDVYVQNLRYFARRDTAMSCERPIAPFLRNRIQQIEWEDLDPGRYPELLRAVVSRYQHWQTRAPKDEEQELRRITEAIGTKEYAFRRAKLKLQGATMLRSTNRSPYLDRTQHYLQFGPNLTDPQSPDSLSRCEPRRGGPPREIWSLLRLYLVSEDLKRVLWDVTNPHNGSSGEALRLIDGRPYVETANTRGNIQLLEINRDDPSNLDAVCLFLFNSAKR
jgi:hypothetical protein